METHYTYILTNKYLTCLYIGQTHDLRKRLYEHQTGLSKFTKSYNCYYIVYFEIHPTFEAAYNREHQIKKWSRKKKDWLIVQFNPERIFLNDLIFENVEIDNYRKKLNFDFIDRCP